MGKYDKAIEALEKVRRRSRDWVSSQNRLGAAHWAKSRDLERRGDSAGSQSEAQKAIEVLNIALKARRESGAGPTDPGLVGNTGDLATVLTETGKPKDALALLAPIVKAQTVKSGAGYAGLDGSPAQSLYHRRQGRAGDRLDEGNRTGRGRRRTGTTYFKLGKLLEKELDRLKETGKYGCPIARCGNLTRRF